MRLRHLHLNPHSLTRYAHASRLQESLVSQFLSHKASPATIPAPPPTLLTFSPLPVYTTGRRQLGTYTTEQIALLREPLTTFDPTDPSAHARLTPQFYEARRGGQITFHGPGQLVGYPLLDLKSVGLTSRCYVHKLEAAVIATLADFGIVGKRTENPGVWVDDDKKIAALGVHLRRYVSSHGVAMNVHTDLRWFDRIVACGLEGKRTTSLLAEGVCRMVTPERPVDSTEGSQASTGAGQGVTGYSAAAFVPSVEDVGTIFARNLAAALGIEGGIEELTHGWQLYDEGTHEWERFRDLAKAEEERMDSRELEVVEEELEWER